MNAIRTVDHAITRCCRSCLRAALMTVLVAAGVAGCSRTQSMTGDPGPMSSESGFPGDEMPALVRAADLSSAGLPPSAAVVAPNYDAAQMSAPAGAAANQLAQIAASTPFPADISQSGSSSRHIIKNADMVLEVEGVERAVGRVETAAAQAGGYVLETRSDYSSDGLPMAVVGVAVPVDQFETARDRIRDIGMRVISEHASGVDVSQEYVDLESEIANLEATQARIRSFLEQATNVEEALNVNARLTEIEGQISQRKGRLGYLGQRSAFSTLTVELHQVPLSVTPTPTATPTPRPPWNPADTAGDALDTLSVVVRGLGTLAIWLVIVAGPFAVPFLAIYWLLRRRGSKPKDD